MVHVISPCDKHGDNKGDSGIPSSNSVDRGGNFILQDCASHGLPVMADWGGRERGPGCEAAGNRSRKHVRWQGRCESSPVRSCPQSCIIQWTGFEGRWGGSMGGSSGRWRTTGMVGRQAGLLFSPVFDWLSCETCKCAIDEKVQVYPTGTGYRYEDGIGSTSFYSRGLLTQITWSFTGTRETARFIFVYGWSAKNGLNPTCK